jgi:hypothetical protein
MTGDSVWKSGNKRASLAHDLARKLALGMILLLFGLTPASAQTGTGSTGTSQMGGGMMGGGMTGGGHGRNRHQQQNGQPTPALAPLPVVKEPWPRLDSGAILCRTRDDLLQYQIGSGAASTGPPPDCHPRSETNSDPDIGSGWPFPYSRRHNGRCKTDRMDERISDIRTSTIDRHANPCKTLNVAEHGI